MSAERMAKIIVCLLTVGLSCLAGCASQPELHSNQLQRIGHTEIFYIQPVDDIVVVDTPVMNAVHISEAVSLTYLFAGLGTLGYVGDRVSDQKKLDSVLNNHYAAFSALHWPDRIQAAIFAALAQAPATASQPVKTLAAWPKYAEMWEMAKASGADSLLFVQPKLKVNDAGDRMAVALDIYLISYRHAACSGCGLDQTLDKDESVIADESIDVSQEVVAELDGPWEQHREAAHRLHALEPRDYLQFWVEGQPQPIATFMDAAIPAMQHEFVVYLGGKDKTPEPLPALKLVVH